MKRVITRQSRMRNWFLASLTCAISAWASHRQTKELQALFSSNPDSSFDFVAKIGPFETLTVLQAGAGLTFFVFLYHLYLFLYRPDKDFEKVVSTQSYLGVGTKRQAIIGSVVIVLAIAVGLFVYYSMKI